MQHPSSSLITSPLFDFLRRRTLALLAPLAAVLMILAPAPTASAAAGGADGHKAGGEANLVLPDVGTVKFFNDSIDGHTLLLVGIGVSALGMIFGLMIYAQLKAMPVHKSMLDISELIYETCKAYMIQQGKFLMLLWVFIAVAVGWYFGWLIPTEQGHGMPMSKVAIILAFSQPTS